MSQTKKTGNAGEGYTAEYLVKNGYIIKERNYFSRYGEIDIIAEKNGIITFVEVKTRAKNPFSAPREAVTKAKQKKIMRTALQYILQNKVKLQPRFDVSEVIMEKEPLKPVSIHYMEHAFWQEEDYAVF